MNEEAITVNHRNAPFTPADEEKRSRGGGEAGRTGDTGRDPMLLFAYYLLTLAVKVLLYPCFPFYFSFSF